MSEEQTSRRYLPQLDEMLNQEQCAAWLGVTKRWLLENEDKIVPFRMTKKTVMYHPRTVLAKMAFDAGVPLQIIAASHGIVDSSEKP